MAELADAADSKSADRKVMGVRPPLPAPTCIYFIMNNLYHYNTPGIARGVCWAFVASVRNAVVSEKQSSQTSILPKHLMQECSFELLIDKNRKLCHPTKVVECA